eukprot:CAMPEP_0197053746 /NCGR_PEP_ID=MMETSP1384-20130603/27923_1 /TAXON_ID=29189 /ORGANISM="Ammonia sp." /LENGTH=583 /DNA_ID=CAMNT_0042486687 /DNA_START=102 /DNA_END=1853 /DNA_ORIENTATION=+
MTLTYMLELQSRLQHLHSLFESNASLNDEVTAYFRINTEDEEKQQGDMITELHSNNMKLIESVIQNVVYDKSHQQVQQADKEFYQRLNERPPAAITDDDEVKQTEEETANGARAEKRRASIDVSIGSKQQRGGHSSWMQLLDSRNLLTFTTSAAVLYSCGVLFYCLQEEDATLSLIAYVLGIVCLLAVMLIAYLFNMSSLRRNRNEFTMAVILAMLLIYFAVYWISYYFNSTASLILIVAVILAHQYKHAPLCMKQRNLDEIWICLMLNCGIPLFAYYMQLPELTSLQQLQPTPSVQAPAATALDDVLQQQQASVIEAATAGSTQQQQEIEDASTWMVYLFNLLWRILKVIAYDFWQMLDLTYSLQDEQAAEAVRMTQPVVVNKVVMATQTVTAEEVIVDASDVESVAEVSEIDDSLYWFNKVFYVFPYTLFNMILISWFISHSSMLLSNITQYQAVNSKLLYCAEVLLSHVLSVLFWYNDMFDATLFLLMLLSVPWTLGLLKHIYEHKDIVGDAQQISYHASIYNLWFFIAMYLAAVYHWISSTGLLWAFFSPNLVIVVAPFLLILQCMPQIIKEFIWATDF